MKVMDMMRMNICVDVYDNVCDEIGIAFEGPVLLSEEAKREFAEALDLQVDVGPDVAIVDVDAPDWKRRLRKAKEFFLSLAGYCPADDWDRWFRYDVPQRNLISNFIECLPLDEQVGIHNLYCDETHALSPDYIFTREEFIEHLTESSMDKAGVLEWALVDGRIYPDDKWIAFMPVQDDPVSVNEMTRPEIIRADEYADYAVENGCDYGYPEIRLILGEEA